MRWVFHFRKYQGRRANTFSQTWVLGWLPSPTICFSADSRFTLLSWIGHIGHARATRERVGRPSQVAASLSVLTSQETVLWIVLC